MVFDDTLSTVEHMRKAIVPGNWKNLVEEHSELALQENFNLAKYWHLNKLSSIPLPRETFQEDSQEPGNQFITPGYYLQAAPSRMTEDPAPMRGTETISDTPIPSTVEGSLQLGQSH